jgi:hypothetical protein
MSAITLEDLMTRCRERADMVDSEFIEDDELITYINASYTELYDILVSKFEDYYTLPPDDFTISSGNTYDLPSDFYKLRGIDKSLGGSSYMNLRKFNFNERNQDSTYRTIRRVPTVSYRIVGDKVYFEPAAQATGDYRLWYIPAVTLLVDESDTVNGVNGWEEYIVIDTAIKMLSKEESSTSHLETAKESMLRRIDSMAMNRDSDQPERITDNRARRYDYE